MVGTIQRDETLHQKTFMDIQCGHPTLFQCQVLRNTFLGHPAHGTSRDIQLGHPAGTSRDIQLTGHPAGHPGTSRNFSWNSKSTENLDFWIFNVRRTVDTSLAVDWTPKLPTQHRFCPNLPQFFQRRKLELHDITSPQLRHLRCRELRL